MRIKLKPDPELNDERTIKKFLWMPTLLSDEVRWLEYAEIKQVYTNWIHGKQWLSLDWVDHISIPYPSNMPPPPPKVTYNER